MVHTGYIVFAMNHKNVISKVISWFMSSKWSHTILCVGTFRGVLLTCETSDFEVTYGSFNKYMASIDHSFEVFQIDLTENEKDKLTIASQNHLLEMYGYLQLLSFALRICLRKIGIKIGNIIRQGLVCTAVPIYAYNDAGLPHFKDIDPEGLDTEEFYQIIKSRYPMILKKLQGEVLDSSK